MLVDYTHQMTGIPRMVWPGTEPTQTTKRAPTHVIFNTGVTKTTRVYTWSAWAASFCGRAYQEKFPITVAYSETAWGKLLIDVDFAEPEPEMEPAS